MEIEAEKSSPAIPRLVANGAAHAAGGPWTALGICVLLAVLVGAVFAQTWSFDFINLDDDQYITNSAETHLGLTVAGVKWAWTNSQVGNWHPLTTMSFMLDWSLFAEKPAGYHIHNVLLHAACAVLLFLLLRRMTGALWLSAMASAIFAIHPLRVESVAWVTERKDVLSGLYFVLTLYAYAFYVRRPGIVGYLAVLLLFALGLMCKAMLVTLPVVMLLLDYWPLGRLGGAANKGAGKRWGFWWLVLEKVPMLLLAGAFSVVTAHLSLAALRAVAVLPMHVRLAMAPISAVTYLGQMFYPCNLAANYPYAEEGPPGWKVAAACGVLLAISAGVCLVGRKRPYLAVGWLWYVVTILPVIGLIPGGNQLMADRYTYLPQIGLYMALVWAAGDLWMSWPRRAWAGAAAGIIVVAVLLVMASRQTSYWRDSETLWRHALACTTDNGIAHEHLAVALEQQAREAAAKNDLEVARARIAEAKTEYEQTLKFTPKSLPGLCNLGGLRNEEGKADEAIALFERAIKVSPKLAEAHYNLGNVLLRQGKYDEAIACYRRALDAAPQHAPAHNNLAILLAEKGNLEEAIEHYRQAVAAAPQYADAYSNLGNALLKQGKVAEAQDKYHRALAINPKLAGACTNLGDISRDQGQLDAAVGYYKQALLGDPGYLQACNNLGDVLNRQGKIDDAITVYQQAVGIAPNSLVVRYNLGICLEKKGRKEEALAAFQKALELAQNQKDTGATELIRNKIASFNTGGP